MKKLYFILTAAVTMFFATEASAQIEVEVGYSLTDHVIKALGENEGEMLDGLYLGVNCDVNFLDNEKGMLDLEAGVRFTYALTQESERLLGVQTKVSVNESYLDIPIYAKYSYDLTSMTLSAFAGPIFSCGLTSETKVGLNDNVVTTNNYEKDSVYGRFDLKIGVGIGVTFSDRYSTKVGYNIGLLDRYAGKLDNASLRTGVFYVGVGFNF